MITVRLGAARANCNSRAYLEKKSLSVSELPGRRRSRDPLVLVCILGPFCPVQAQEDFIAAENAGLGDGFCAGAIDLDAYLAVGVAQSHIWLSDNEGKRLTDRI